MFYLLGWIVSGEVSLEMLDEDLEKKRVKFLSSFFSSFFRQGIIESHSEKE